MTTQLEQAARQALEALEPLVRRAAPWGEIDWLNGRKAITALHAALSDAALERMAENARELGLNYEQPAQDEPKREWVGLTYSERLAVIQEDENRSLLEHCERIEANLKEKNTQQDTACKYCTNGCAACDARRQSNDLS